MITVIDNYITDKDFEHIRDWAFSHEVEWRRSPGVADDDDTHLGYFYHQLYNDQEPKSRWLHEGMVAPLIQRAKMAVCLRIKMNLYPSTETIQYHAPHKDLPFPHQAAVYCLNTCDGGTTIGTTRIDSVANRMIIFNGNEDHFSSTCTDQPVRMNINFNWLNPYADNNEIPK